MTPVPMRTIICLNEMKKKMLSRIIYGNVTFFVYVILAAIVGVYQRQLCGDWNARKDVRMEYNILFGSGFILFSLVSIIGLVMKKEWGRVTALIFNWILFFSCFVMRIGVYFFTKYSYGKGIMVFDIDALVITCFSLFFMICLSKRDIKTKFRTG